MPPNVNPTTELPDLGKKKTVKAIKVILVQADVKPFQDMIDSGWLIAQSYSHALGTLFMMVQEG